MDMNGREQYLETLRGEYQRGSKRQKTRLLSEAQKRTRLNRKVLIRKLAHPPAVKRERKRPVRGSTYGADVVRVLVRVWVMFDCPCGQRLAPALGQEVDRLRKNGEVRCSDGIGEKLKRISPKTIDRLLTGERRTRQLRKNRNPEVHPLLYQKIPVKVASEWDTRRVGNLQADLCGTLRTQQWRGLRAHSLAGRHCQWMVGRRADSGKNTEGHTGGDRADSATNPISDSRDSSDNDGGLINELLWGYCKQKGIRMSRSRPYQNNDNAWRNWTHVRKMVGYQRYDTMPELLLLRELYG